MEARVPIPVSAEEEGGRTFVVRGRRSPPLQVSCVSCGQYHTAVSTVEGKLYVWGANVDGQLGLGDTKDRGCPSEVAIRDSVVDSPSVAVLQVDCGGRHTVAVSHDGHAWSWGCNAHRQLGHDASGPACWRPTYVLALGAECVVQVACGGAHTAAVTADGACFTWGKNQNGQLGHGVASPSEMPRRVEALPLRVAWVACGGAHTAAMLRVPDGGGGGGGGESGLSSRTSLSEVSTSRGSEPSASRPCP